MSYDVVLTPGEDGVTAEFSRAAEAEIVDRLTRAWETADIDGAIALFRDDVWLTMPPMPLEYQGRRPGGGVPPRGRLPPGPQVPVRADAR